MIVSNRQFFPPFFCLASTETEEDRQRERERQRKRVGVAETVTRKVLGVPLTACSQQRCGTLRARVVELSPAFSSPDTKVTGNFDPRE